MPNVVHPSPSILITTLQGRKYYLYFTNEETEAQEARNRSEEAEQVAATEIRTWLADSK